MEHAHTNIRQHGYASGGADTVSQHLMTSSETPDTTVLVLEDQRVLADAIVSALGAVSGVRVVGAGVTLEEGVDLARTRQPDVVLCDYRMGDVDIPEHLPALREAAPDAAILVFTGWPDESSLLQAMGGGAAGFIEKTVSFDELVDAIRRTAAGETVVSPKLLPLLTRRATGGATQDVSPRELEVLSLLAAGLNTGEIADELILSIHTVRNHIARLMKKLDARSRLEAVNIGVRQGLIRFDPPRE